MRHVISPYDSLPLDDPSFWADKWRAGLSTLDPAVVNPRLAARSQKIWDPLALGKLPAAELRRWIEEALVPDSWWRVLDGKPATEAERRGLLAARDLEAVQDFDGDRYGVTVRRSGLRSLPTSRRGQKLDDEDGFDRLQHTALEPLTPLALLHPSRDRRWWFVLAPDYRGWVRATDIATSERPREIAALLERKGPVLLEALAELAAPGGGTPLQLGDRLPGLEDTEMPFPKRGPAGDLQVGTARLLGEPRLAAAWPELTPKTLFEVAFSALGQPYGWGDLTPNGPGRDCSRYVQDVFKTFGFSLPRDASAQCAASEPALTFAPVEGHAERAAKLAGLKQGPALLCMPGHIMLYLGEVEGCHHAVHSFWAYKRPGKNGEETVPVRRVVVTSLDLGRNTSGGSLLERLTAVNLL